jgi:hypothetical protein
MPLSALHAHLQDEVTKTIGRTLDTVVLQYAERVLKMVSDHEVMPALWNGLPIWVCVDPVSTETVMAPTLALVQNEVIQAWSLHRKKTGLDPTIVAVTPLQAEQLRWTETGIKA